MKIILKKYYEEFVKFLNSPCSYAVIILLFLGNTLFSYTNPSQSSPYEFLKYMVTVIIGGMTTFIVQMFLKSKEQNKLFLNTGLAILRTINSQRSQLITLLYDFRNRQELLQKEQNNYVLMQQKENFIAIVQIVRGEKIIDLELQELYKFNVSNSNLQAYENSLDKLYAWSRGYREIMEISVEMNTVKNVFMKAEDIKNFDPQNSDQYMNVLRHLLPDKILQLEQSLDKSTICYKDFQCTLRKIFGDIPVLMGQDGEINEVF